MRSWFVNALVQNSNRKFIYVEQVLYRIRSLHSCFVTFLGFCQLVVFKTIASLDFYCQVDSEDLSSGDRACRRSFSVGGESSPQQSKEVSRSFLTEFLTELVTIFTCVVCFKQ